MANQNSIPPEAMTDRSLLREFKMIDYDHEDRDRTDALLRELTKRDLPF